MKFKLLFSLLTGTALTAAMLFNACKRNPQPVPNLSAILKDLKPETYFLNFGASDGKVFDKAQYGSLSEWTTIPTKSVDFNIPGYDRIPLYKLVWPTCPAYGVDEILAQKIVGLAKTAKLQGAEELSVVNIDGKALIASKSGLQTLRSYTPDGLDSIGMKGIALGDVTICPDPIIIKVFGARRPVYGIPSPSVREILAKLQIRPGCKDPRALKVVLENFQAFDKVAFSKYQVRELDAKTAVLEQLQ